MIIQNSSKPIQIRIRAFLMTLFLAVSLILVYTTGLFDNGWWKFSQHELTYLALVAYLLPSFYFYALDVYYVYIYLDKKKMIVRYYSLRPLGSAKKTIEIPVAELLRIEIKNSFFGKKKKMILYRKVKDKVAVYEPVSLSGYNAHEMKKLYKVFKPVIKKGTRK